MHEELDYFSIASQELSNTAQLTAINIFIFLAVQHRDGRVNENNNQKNIQ